MRSWEYRRWTTCFCQILGVAKSLQQTIVINQTLDSTADPPHEIAMMEDELDAADTLISLSNTVGIDSVPDNDFGVEDNSLLVPIGGRAICNDIAPTESRLGQIEIDQEIAQIIDSEEHTNPCKLQQLPMTSLIGVQTPASSLFGASDTVQESQELTNRDLTHPMSQSANSLIGIPTTEAVDQPPNVKAPTEDASTLASIDVANTPALSGDSNDDHQSSTPLSVGARPKTADPIVQKGSKGTRGAFKSQLYGLRRKIPKDRSYKCSVCGKSKRSMEALNEHHRARHDSQKCGICGKFFDLATSLSHHMYSHYSRKYQCEKCEYHCLFKSELESHMIVHRETPSHQCQFPKCGKWFKCKGELALHVETHKKTWYDCKKCDFSTKLIKYLKEHEKSHLKKTDKLPYECKICGDRFLWRSGLKRHRDKKHSG